jgi:hypothetical protein
VSLVLAGGTVAPSWQFHPVTVVNDHGTRDMRLTILAAALLLAPSLALAQSGPGQAPTRDMPPTEPVLQQPDKSKIDPATERSGGVPSDQSSRSGSSQDTGSQAPGPERNFVSPPSAAPKTVKP